MNGRIAELQKEIFEKQKELNKLKLEQDFENIKNYVFKDKNENNKSLKELFGGKDELLVIHNMGKSCVYCTMWADVLSGMYHVIKDRVNIVLTSPDDVAILKTFAENRNWNIPYYSYNGTDFSKDLGFAYDKENKRWYMPGVSALIIKDDEILRTAYDFFGPGDMYCPPWQLFELLPKGDNGWQPKYEY